MGLLKMPLQQGVLGMLNLHLISFIAKQSISCWSCLNNLNYSPVATDVLALLLTIICGAPGLATNYFNVL